MARPPRPLAAGLTYHVTTRGNRRQSTFADDEDRRRFLRGLTTVVAELEWSVTSYCLMPNHVHLLVHTPRPDLSKGMQLLLGGYARDHNTRHGRTGHLFQGRFHSVVVTADAHHLELHRYLALNPVRSGICRRPEEHPWSAHRALLGLVRPPAFLDVRLAAFAGDRERCASFVDAANETRLADLVGDGTPACLAAAAAEGFGQTAIARQLGTSQKTVSRRLRDYWGSDPVESR